MKLAFCFVLMQMLLLAFSNKLVKHEFECYNQKNVYVTYALNIMDGSQNDFRNAFRNEFSIRNDDAIFSMNAKHKISFNVSTCMPNPANSYCRNKNTHWQTVPCYQRYRNDKVLVKCYLVSVKEGDEDPQQMFLTYGVRIRFFKNDERRKEETITNMIPFTPYMICF